MSGKSGAVRPQVLVVAQDDHGGTDLALALGDLGIKAPLTTYAEAATALSAIDACLVAWTADTLTNETLEYLHHFGNQVPIVLVTPTPALNGEARRLPTGTLLVAGSGINAARRLAELARQHAPAPKRRTSKPLKGASLPPLPIPPGSPIPPVPVPPGSPIPPVPVPPGSPSPQPSTSLAAKSSLPPIPPPPKTPTFEDLESIARSEAETLPLIPGSSSSALPSEGLLGRGTSGSSAPLEPQPQPKASSRPPSRLPPLPPLSQPPARQKPSQHRASTRPHTQPQRPPTKRRLSDAPTLPKAARPPSSRVNAPPPLPPKTSAPPPPARKRSAPPPLRPKSSAPPPSVRKRSAPPPLRPKSSAPPPLPPKTSAPPPSTQGRSAPPPSSRAPSPLSSRAPSAIQGSAPPPSGPFFTKSSRPPLPASGSGGPSAAATTRASASARKRGAPIPESVQPVTNSRNPRRRRRRGLWLLVVTIPLLAIAGVGVWKAPELQAMWEQGSFTLATAPQPTPSAVPSAVSSGKSEANEASTEETRPPEEPEPAQEDPPSAFAEAVHQSPPLDQVKADRGLLRGLAQASERQLLGMADDADRKQDSDTALHFVANAVDRFPHSPHTRQAHVRILLHQGDAPLALEKADSYLRSQPDADLVLLRGDALAALGRHEEAIQTWTAGLNARGQQTIVNRALNLGRHQSRRGHRAETKRMMRRVALLRPDHVEAITGVVEILLLENDPKPAVEWARLAVKAAPDAGASHALLGRALAAAGDKDEAAKTLHHAVKLNPGDKQAVRLLMQLERE